MKLHGTFATVAAAIVIVGIVAPTALTGVAAAQADAEPNDDFSSAGPIPEGTTDGRIVDGESDFFRFEANGTDAVDLRVEANSGDVDVRVYRPDRTQLVDGFINNGGADTSTVKAPTTGTYYIEVSGRSGVTTDYTVDLDVVTPSENDAFAPNDDFDSAASIAEGFSDATIWGGESDFFRIEANDTDAVDVRVDADRGDVNVRLYRPDRTRLVDGFINNGGSEALTVKAPETGTYYLEVDGQNAQTTTNYTVDLDVVTPSENDAFAPNDGFDSAAAIDEGFTDATVWGGESDLFRFEANGTDAVDVRVDAVRGDVNVRLYRPDRTQLVDGFINNGGSEALTVKAPETGTYYLEVDGQGTQTTTNYTVDLDVVTPSENDAFAPNDDFDSAAAIDEGFSDATIWGGESDFFRIDADDTDAVDVRVEADRGDVNVRLYRPDRTRLVDGFINNGGSDTLTVKAPTSGTYYLEVDGQGTQTTTDYTVDLDVVTPSENDAFAPNDDFDSAAAITREFSDARIWGGESDVFRIDLTAGESIETGVTVDRGDVNVRLYGPNRTEVESGFVNNGGTLTRTYTPTESGTHYVEIDGQDAQTTTDYTLRSNRTQAPVNRTPTADAGNDRTVAGGANVTLDATGSSDPEGDALAYQWTQTAGASVGLSGATTATPTFVAPRVASNATLTFELTVDDGVAGTATDAVDVTVTPSNGSNESNPFPNGVPGVGTAPPTDTDPRRGYEDVNGDGSAGFDDVVDLLFALSDVTNADLTASQEAAVDFDGRGGVGFGDVVELLFRVV